MITSIIQDINKMIYLVFQRRWELPPAERRPPSRHRFWTLMSWSWQLAAAAGGALFCGGFFEVQVGEFQPWCLFEALQCGVFTKSTFKKKTYLFVKNVPLKALQWLGGDVLLLHDQPLFHRAVCFQRHFPFVISVSLWIRLESFVQAVPLPHLKECKWPEAALPINGPVYIDLKVAGDLWKQPDILQQEILHPLVRAHFSFRVAALLYVQIK